MASTLGKIDSRTFIAALTALTVVNGAVQIHTIKLGALYYGILIIILALIFFQSPIKKVSYTISFLYISCIISIVVNNIPPEYRVWERFGLFAIITLITSPFIQSNFLDKFRIITFTYIQYLLLVIIILSVSAFVTGEKGITGFEGFTSHSMIMSSIAAISIITLFYLLYSKKLSWKIVTPLLILAFPMMLMGASRIALSGCLCGLLFFFYKINRNNITQFVKAVIIITVLLSATYPLWNSYLSGIEAKNKTINEDTGEKELTSSRDIMWQQRLKEFESSPMIGIGFCYAPYIASIDKQTGEIEFTNTKTGIIEPGSAWLGILSMTGILGFLCILVLWIRSFHICMKLEKKDFYFSILLSSLLVYYSIQMIAEGAIYSAGGFDCFMIWILIGTIQSSWNVYNMRNSENIITEKT
ncbi:MAG: O-antigen ligase family protein [Bacteroidales bacterium]